MIDAHDAVNQRPMKRASSEKDWIVFSFRSVAQRRLIPLQLRVLAGSDDAAVIRDLIGNLRFCFLQMKKFYPENWRWFGSCNVQGI